LAPIQGVHLRGISPLLVFVVERCANAIADETTQHASDRGACETVSRAAAGHGSSNHRTGPGADHCPGTLPRSRPGRWRRYRSGSRSCTWPHPIRTASAGGERKADDHNSGGFRHEHIVPRKAAWKANQADVGRQFIEFEK
jgi:hypothetical protein